MYNSRFPRNTRDILIFRIILFGGDHYIFSGELNKYTLYYTSSPKTDIGYIRWFVCTLYFFVTYQIFDVSRNYYTKNGIFYAHTSNIHITQ